MNQLQLKNIAVFISLILILVFFTQSLGSSNLFSAIALLLFVLLGIPHGATDYLLYKFLNKKSQQENFFSFLFKYFLLSAVFLMVWYLTPWLALIIFLAVSAYHFGQANWNYLKVDKSFKNIVYFSWGGFVLAGSLLWNYNETQPIVESLIGFDLALTKELIQLTPALFLALNIFLTFFLFLKSKLSRKEFFTEIISLSALSLLFTITPLLIGFSCFFVFWHSTVSMADQINAFQEKIPDFSFRNYVVAAAPMSLVVFAFLGGALFFSGGQPITDNNVGQFFKFISIITLPHTFLMDNLLEKPAFRTFKLKFFNNLNFSKKLISQKRNVKQL